jgi:hypothetical protein
MDCLDPERDLLRMAAQIANIPNDVGLGRRNCDIATVEDKVSKFGERR